MNWDAIGALGNVIGGISVVVTLIYVAMQIRQNTKALKVSSYADFVARHINNLEIETQNAELIARSRTSSYADLSPAEDIILVCHLSGILRNGDALYYQFQQGLLDRPRWDSVAKMVAIVITESEPNRSIWRGVENRYESGYGSEINKRLQDIANHRLRQRTERQ